VDYNRSLASGVNGEAGCAVRRKRIRLIKNSQSNTVEDKTPWKRKSVQEEKGGRSIHPKTKEKGPRDNGAGRKEG